MSEHVKSHHKHTRFYIFMITLVVTGVFFVLYSNNDSGGTNLGSAIVGYAVGNNPENGGILEKQLRKTNDGDFKVNSKEVPVSLEFDKIPKVNEQPAIELIKLVFDSSETVIRVNNDKLDLNNLKEVDLTIEGFEGQFDLSDKDLLLSGKANKIEVNGLKFSSEEAIQVSFEELDYKLLDVSNIKLRNLKFGQGNGNLEVAKKLDYSLEEESVEIFNFIGNLKIDESSNSSLLNLNGNARNVDVSGSSLDLSLW